MAAGTQIAVEGIRVVRREVCVPGGVGCALAPLNKVIVSSADPVPVWPHPNEPVRGMCLAPLYPSVLEAAMRDEKLYAKLSLFDALRAGQAREREAAKRLLKPYFK